MGSQLEVELSHLVGSNMSALSLADQEVCQQPPCRVLAAVECLPPGRSACVADGQGNIGSGNTGLGNFGNDNSGSYNIGELEEEVVVGEAPRAPGCGMYGRFEAQARCSGVSWLCILVLLVRPVLTDIALRQ